MADFNSQRQIQIHCDNFKFTTANSMRQIQIHHGKFIAAISHSLRQNQIHHGKFRFATANKKLITADSIQIHHCKFK